MILYILAVIISFQLCVLFVHVQRAFGYWKRKHVPFVQPRFPFGNIQLPLTATKPAGLQLQGIYRDLKSRGHKHGGFFLFTNPAYLPIDPHYVRLILAKDFEYFTDRGMYCNARDDPLSSHIFTMPGEQWKRAKEKLMAPFTPSKLKATFETLLVCGDLMARSVNKGTVEIKSLSACFTTDSMMTAMFGLDSGCLNNPSCDLRNHESKLATLGTLPQRLKNTLFFMNGKLAKVLNLHITDKNSANYFLDLFKSVLDYRRKNDDSRNDLTGLLTKLKEVENWGLDEISGHAFILFVGGVEVASAAIAFCLYELSINPDVQKKLTNEIKEFCLEKCVTYNTIHQMQYLNQVVEETLRKYPTGSALRRLCVKDYKLPDSDIVIEKGTKVFISVLGLHHDPEYFPQPEKFDPERFSPEKRKLIPRFSYIPIGKGPRTCLGQRLGITQIKVCLLFLLKNFRFTLNPKTKTPLVMDPFTLVLSSKNQIYLDVHQH